MQKPNDTAMHDESSGTTAQRNFAGETSALQKTKHYEARIEICGEAPRACSVRKGGAPSFYFF
jgi:hypothetical protein